MNYKSNRSVSVFVERVFLLLVIFCFVCQSAFGGDVADKKTYDMKLDSLWSRTTYIQYLSKDGKWVALTEEFDTKENLLHLMNTENSTRLRMRNGSFLAFSDNNNWFGSISPDNELEICNLLDQSRRVWVGISSYYFSPTGDQFAAEKINQGKGNSLIVVHLKETSVVEMKGLSEYEWHPVNGILAACLGDSSSSQVILYNAETHSRKILINSKESKYCKLQWNSTGNTLVFLEQYGSNHLLHHYNMSDSKLTTVVADMDNPYPGSRLMVRNVTVSDDGATVIFSSGSDHYSREQTSMEVWDTGEPWIYPRLKKLYGVQRPLYLIAWDIRSGILYRITDENTPDAMYNPNVQNALVYNRLMYEPQYKQETDVDLYIKNFRTGKKQLIVQKQYTYRGFIKHSPTGRFVTYFKDYNWWVYDSESQNTFCLTEGLGLHFEKTDDDPKDDKEPYGNPGWSENEEYIILYDRYDIWLMTPDGSNRLRITQGREKQIQYRISLNLIRNDRDFIRSLAVPGSFVFKIKDGLILEMMGDDFNTGYALLKSKDSLETMVYGPGKVDEILMSYDRCTIAFKKSRYNEPPAIYTINMVSKEIRLVYQSNEKLNDFDLGRDLLVSFKGGKRGSLSGALIYPAQFDPGKKYPMIVCIYEKNSKLVNDFEPPSDYEQAGFNVLRYVTNGYFVLLPDIGYTIGEPGISALNAVTGLTERVLENEFIDKNRVGLIGHSFGGYEASFIATQTNIFRAVVAGAAITDLVSWYHDMQGGGWDTEQMWRLENHQLRMGGSYYDLKKQYTKNSPLQNVEKLDTPLLLWVGKNDYNVNWYQGIYMFMAMKRLNKEGKLLFFKDEGHSMVNPENKKRLTEEIFSWFNYYLKEGRSE